MDSVLRKYIPCTFSFPNHLSPLTHRNVSKAQYVRKLDTWGFSKNVTVSSWQRAASLVKKRKELGKDSAIAMNGKPIPQKKLKKELSRYGYLENRPFKAKDGKY